MPSQSETPARSGMISLAVFYREQDFLSLAQCNEAFKYLIPILVALVQVGVQGRLTSPMVTHPANVYTFVLATSIFAFTVINQTSNASQTGNSPDQAFYSELFVVVAFISGSLSSVSLISILATHLIGYIIFISWATFVSLFVAYKHATLIKKIFDLILQKIKNTGGWFKKMWGKVKSLCSDRHILPK